MKENLRIKKLFEDLFAGEPWLDVNLVQTLEGIPWQQAAKKPAALPNSIWEIVNHIISWRENVLQRLQGKSIPTPEHNYFLPVEEHSEAAWNKSLLKLNESQAKWIHYLGEMDTTTFDTVYPANNKSAFEHIHGIIQHDAYHLGQIVLLAKHF